jgi:prephenate dehydrogenase
MTMKAGIIGGTGRMGRLFVPVFGRAGYDVIVSGRKTALTNAELAKACDIVIVSVPIHDTVRVIEEIAPLLTKDQLLCDFTSLKVRPVGAMLKSKAQVIGLHPMFGPTVSSLRSQTIIVCPVRVEEHLLNNLVSIFTAEGARCTATTPEEHDRMMAVVQGLTHFVTLCMSDTIRRLGVRIGSTEAFTSPVYQIELSLMGRLLSQDPDLYADILQQNPFVAEVLEACCSSAEDLRSLVGSGDPEAFSLFFKENSSHLGSYAEKGQEMTDALIECMVNR